MNINLPKKEKMSRKAIIIYSIAILICVIAAIVIVSVQYFGKGGLDGLISISSNTEQTDLQLLKTEFNAIFDNALTNESGINVEKIDNEKDIVFTNYTKQEVKENSYDLDLNIPKINIDKEKINEYNKEIEDTFIQKAENVLKTQNMNTIYTVQYTATIEDDILSLIIYSKLKDGSSAQRVIVTTYNYDLKNDSEIRLNDLINRKNLKKADVENKIKQEISAEQKKVEDLRAFGYEIFERDVNSDMYKVDNTEEFFIKDGKIYLIYAYGNESLTSEMDLVVI